MSGANHVAGGFVFTGIFASFWNINIFSDPVYMAFTAFFSVLPDIDHTKSPIGKLFYPLSRFLDRKFGHRTITHSLLVYFGLFAIVSFICTIYLKDNTITIIYAFSYLSHLIFDMMTKQGVPLFYPFKRNACVLPENPEYRLRSSDFKTESICFVVFVLLGLTCKPLFANGFWTTYNQQFNTLKHVNNEFINSTNYVKVDYDYSFQGIKHKGTGFVIDSKPTNAILFNQKTGFTEIKDNYIISTLKPIKTNQLYKQEEIFFFNISPDSLLKLVHNKPLISFKLQSNHAVSFLKDKKPTTSKSFDLDFVFNPAITFDHDSTEIELRNRLELLRYELHKSKNENKTFISDKHHIEDSIKHISKTIPTMALYEREKATETLFKLKAKLENFSAPSDNSEKVLLQIRQIEDKLKSTNSTACSGYISFVIL